MQANAKLGRTMTLLRHWIVHTVLSMAMKTQRPCLEKQQVTY